MNTREKNIFTRWLTSRSDISSWREEVVIDKNGNILQRDVIEKLLSRCLGFRIDAICTTTDNKTLLCEVKKKQDMRALGQLITYRQHYLRNEKRSIDDIETVLICEETDEALREVFEDMHIRVDVVRT